jgi:hypothetical protein
MCNESKPFREVLEDVEHMVDQAEEGFFSIDDLKALSQKLKRAIEEQDVADFRDTIEYSGEPDEANE